MRLVKLSSSRTRWLGVPLAAALAAFCASQISAQTSAESLSVTNGKSIVIDYPTDVGRISTSNPDIVDAVAVSTREILLHAKGLGTSTIVVWAKTGQRTFYNISVVYDLEPVRTLLKETFPDESIHVEAARDSVTLTGTVSSAVVSDRISALVASLAKAVINNLQITAPPVDKQIMLRVKFAELNRTASKQFGVNLMSLGALNTPAATSTGQFSPPSLDSVGGTIPGGIPGTSTNFTLSDALNIFAFRPDLSLAGTIRALQSQGVLQILAEPNLVTSNGKEASFLVGGEFPVPVLQGGSNAGAVTIMFREFGIRLTFTPVMTTHNTLKMHVKPEVSTIDLANAVTFSGFTIPALATRRVETDIELGPGQSFVIGGLVDDRLDETMSKIPGLSSIPILGQLFKSRSERKQKTELVVLVTPEIVDPLNPADPKPMPIMPHEFLPPLDNPHSELHVPAEGTQHASADPAPAQSGEEDRTQMAKVVTSQEIQAKVPPTGQPQEQVIEAPMPDAASAQPDTAPDVEEPEPAAGQAAASEASAENNEVAGSQPDAGSAQDSPAAEPEN